MIGLPGVHRLHRDFGQVAVCPPHEPFIGEEAHVFLVETQDAKSEHASVTADERPRRTTARRPSRIEYDSPNPIGRDADRFLRGIAELLKRPHQHLGGNSLPTLGRSRSVATEGSPNSVAVMEFQQGVGLRGHVAGRTVQREATDRGSRAAGGNRWAASPPAGPEVALDPVVVVENHGNMAGGVLNTRIGLQPTAEVGAIGIGLPARQHQAGRQDDAGLQSDQDKQCSDDCCTLIGSIYRHHFSWGTSKPQTAQPDTD